MYLQALSLITWWKPPTVPMLVHSGSSCILCFSCSRALLGLGGCFSLPVPRNGCVILSVCAHLWGVSLCVLAAAWSLTCCFKWQKLPSLLRGNISLLLGAPVCSLRKLFCVTLLNNTTRISGLGIRQFCDFSVTSCSTLCLGKGSAENW